MFVVAIKCQSRCYIILLQADLQAIRDVHMLDNSKLELAEIALLLHSGMLRITSVEHLPYASPGLPWVPCVCIVRAFEYSLDALLTGLCMPFNCLICMVAVAVHVLPAYILLSVT